MKTLQRYDLAIKWGPAWTDEALDSPTNYDREFHEGLTFQEAVEVMAKFRDGLIEATLSISEETKS